MRKLKRLQPSKRHTLIAAFVAGCLTLGISGAAMAAFITGAIVTSNSVTTATISGFQGTAIGTVTGTVSPGTDSAGTGATGATILYDVTNTSTSPETLTGATYTITSTAPDGCSNSDYVLHAQGTIPITLKPGDDGTAVGVQVDMPPRDRTSVV